jgi:hypothetical protein
MEQQCQEGNLYTEPDDTDAVEDQPPVESHLPIRRRSR